MRPKFDLQVWRVCASFPTIVNVYGIWKERCMHLAGLECFELYGPHPAAPPLNASQASDSDQRNADSFQLYALASCMATPITGEVCPFKVPG